MNRKISPQSRSTSRPRARSRGRGAQASDPASRIAHKAGAEAKARRTRAPLSKAGRIRRMVLTVALPQAVLILAIVAVSLGVLLLSGSSLAWLPTAIAQAWLVFNLGPVAAGGITISLPPLLPALIFALLLGRRIRITVRHKISVKEVTYLAVASIAVPVVLTLIAWLMLWDAGKVFDVSAPNLLTVLPRILLLHISVLIGGMGSRLWRALAKRFGFSSMLVDAALAAARYLGYATAAAAVILAIVAATGWSRQSELLASYPQLDSGGILALVVLSLLYLPNALIYTIGVLSGAQLHVGEASISLFNVDLVALPPLPLFGAIPATAHPWAVILLLTLPGTAAFLFARHRPSFQFAALSALMTVVAMAVLAYLSSGELGYYGFSGVRAWSGALCGIWLAAVGIGFAAAYSLIDFRRARATENAPNLQEPTVREGTSSSTAVEEEPASTADAEADAAVETETAGQNETADVPAEDEPTSSVAEADEEDVDGEEDVDNKEGVAKEPEIVEAEVVETEFADGKEQTSDDEEQRDDGKDSQR